MLNDSTRQELVELEHAMWREETRFNPGFQERHFAPGFFEFGRSGRVYNRDQVIAAASQPIDAALQNIRITELSAGLVLITYDSVLQRGPGTVEYSRRSSIWSKASGSWQMHFHQGTPFSPAA